MTLLKKYYSKFFFKQYSIGVVEDTLEEIIRQKKTTFKFEWMPAGHYSVSIADPFVFASGNGKINILAEKFTTGNMDGKICLLNYSKTTGFSKPEIIFDHGEHLSYPFIFEENEKMYVLLTELNGALLCYEYDRVEKKLFNKKAILNFPLIDATVLTYNNKYWLFGTFEDKGSLGKLYIYYADHLAGPYTAHPDNPVKDNIKCSRGAGSFIMVDGNIYRPSQNCSNYYGEAVVINKIVTLSETEFEEEAYMTINANNNDEFKFGIHTINTVGNFTIVDGQKGYFQPLSQLFRAVARFLRPHVNKLSVAFGYMHSIQFIDSELIS